MEQLISTYPIVQMDKNELLEQYKITCLLLRIYFLEQIVKAEKNFDKTELDDLKQDLEILDNVYNETIKIVIEKFSKRQEEENHQ